MSTSPSSSDVVVLHPARADLGAIVPQRADTVELREATDLTNVIPFRRPAEGAHAAPEVVLPAELARPPAKPARDLARLAAFIVLSLALHGAAAAALLWHEPEPLASVGLETITVEITLGATAPVGAAPTPGENETPSPAVPEPQATEMPTETKPADEVATAQPQSVEVAKEETAPEQKAEPPKAEEPKDAVREPEPAVATVEAPRADPPREAKPVETPPPQTEPEPIKDAAPAKEPRRIAAPTREKPTRQAKAATAAAPANNIGVGRSSDDTNYRGAVAAHLSRYKHPLPDTRGTASVTFTIGGSGAVTSVRLAHGSGVASIDSEVQAMVRRASPFPPPPGGRPQSFTVPVSFKVN